MNKLDKIKLTWYSSYKINNLREQVLSILKPSKTTKIVFIFGCQRSGTTIIQKLVGLNPNVKFYGEGDPPYFYNSDSDKHHRIRSNNDINYFLKKETSPFIIIKPLYESHSAHKLVSDHTNSKGIWVFRNYLDVIDSHIHYYKQNANDYIRPLFTENKDNWINEFIPESTKQFIKQFSLDELSDADAYGLFWIVRNSIFQSSAQNKNILLINYENLVKEPTKEITKIYRFIGLPFKKYYSKLIRSNAVSKKVSFELNPKIEEKCKKIYDNLLNHCQ